jgi:hypothetical protein
MTAAAEAAAIVADVFGDDWPTLKVTVTDDNPWMSMHGPGIVNLPEWRRWSEDVLAWAAAEEAEGVRKPVAIKTVALNRSVQAALRRGDVDRAVELIEAKVTKVYGLEGAA